MRKYIGICLTLLFIGAICFSIFNRDGEDMLEYYSSEVTDENQNYDYLGIVERNGFVGFINEYGREVIPCQFEVDCIENIGVFEDGFLLAAYKYGYWSEESEYSEDYLINGQGKRLNIPYAAGDFVVKDNMVIVYDEEHCGAIDPNGNVVVDFKYDSEEDLLKGEGIPADHAVSGGFTFEYWEGKNENGWITQETPEGIKFLDKNKNVVLSLGAEYYDFGYFMKIR